MDWVVAMRIGAVGEGSRPLSGLAKDEMEAPGANSESRSSSPVSVLMRDCSRSSFLLTFFFPCRSCSPDTARRSWHS